MTNLIRKNVFELTISDFEEHPVWFDFVDDDDIVVATNEEVEDEGVYYLKSHFVFSDDSEHSGYTRLVDGYLATIAIWKADRFVVYPLSEQIRLPIRLSSVGFAETFGREEIMVFPIQYRLFIDQDGVMGWIPAHTRSSIHINW